MSEKRLNAWGKWQQTRNNLATSLALNVEKMNKSPVGSNDEAQAKSNIDQTLKDIQAHALEGLRLVDLEIANSVLVSDIEASSERAKKEADRLMKATASIEELTAFVVRMTALVARFAAV